MYYAFDYYESDRVEACIREGKDFGHVNLKPQTTDEILHDDDWLVWEPCDFSWNAKDYASYEDAVKDFVCNIGIQIFEHDNDC